MIRSLRTGVSGIKSNQTWMDVIGNNVSNANTVAFKRSRANFNETLAQRLAAENGANPSFVGLGTNVGSIDQSWQQGSFKKTGMTTDLALEGDGFFVIENRERTMLSRAGNFSFNQEGELVTPQGYNVQGWTFEDDGTLATGAPTDIAIDLNNDAPPKFTETAEIGGNLSADTAVGDTRSISTSLYDEQGVPHSVVVDFTKQGANQWDYSLQYTGSKAPPPFNNTNGTVSFNTDGTLDQVDGNNTSQISVDWDTNYVSADASGNAQSFALDLGQLVQYSGSTTSKFRDQDGYAAGTVAGYNINREGILQVKYSNGEQRNAFQLALGNVNNPNGLEQEGQNLYTVSNASGDLQLGRAGRDTRTSVVSGALEMSNVDLATEFSDMIVAQRGYQASARVISTSDEMLQELVRLKQ